MLSGELYDACDEQLLRELNETKEVIHRYNQLTPSDTQGRIEMLKGLLGHNIGEVNILSVVTRRNKGRYGLE